MKYEEKFILKKNPCELLLFLWQLTVKRYSDTSLSLRLVLYLNTNKVNIQI